MKLLHTIWREFIGMFIDDGALAAQVGVLIALVTGAIKLAGVPPLWAAAVLIPGCLGILAASIKRAQRK